jgi:hypothetical protein
MRTSIYVAGESLSGWPYPAGWFGKSRLWLGTIYFVRSPSSDSPVSFDLGRPARLDRDLHRQSRNVPHPPRCGSSKRTATHHRFAVR